MNKDGNASVLIEKLDRSICFTVIAHSRQTKSHLKRITCQMVRGLANGSPLHNIENCMTLQSRRYTFRKSNCSSNEYCSRLDTG